jgi:hypothetical protein
MIISPEAAEQITGKFWLHEPLKATILLQSAAAYRGLLLVMGGSVLQAFGAGIQIWPSLQTLTHM